MNLDQKQPGWITCCRPISRSLGVEYRIVTENTYKIVKEKIPEGKDDLFTALFEAAPRHHLLPAKRSSATKIALGHHRDDMIRPCSEHVLY